MLGKVAFAVLFGLAFILVVFLNDELFTGNCLTTIIPVYTKKLKFVEILPNWIICYLGNFIGASFIGALFILSGSLSHQLPDFLSSVLVYKLDFDITQLIIRSILCNFIVCIASFVSYKVKSESEKVIILFIVIIAFVLPGFDHSIANMVTFAMGITAFPSTINYSMILLDLLFSTFGNILGGSILLALPLYFIHKPSLIKE
jgi:nitrite transporter NirC